MTLIDNSGWYALVKYKSGNETEVLPIQNITLKIRKGERVLFNPKSLTDFDRIKFYTVHTTHGSKDEREHKWYAHIGLLAETREALESAMDMKRISWPNVLNEDQSEPNSTDTDNVVLEGGNLTVTSNRDLNKNKKMTKKQATDAIHAQLLASRNLYQSCTTRAPVTADDDITRLLRENAELKSALQAEKEKSISSGEVREDQNIVFAECLQRIEAAVGKMQDQFQKQLEANMEKLTELEKKIENLMSKFSQPYSQYVEHWLNSLPENENIEYIPC
ncbi:uncharacterized protein LOC114255254 [Monomorium pharaonis]|uniref:uncharacterized protein LOC114255254 n=1 Tax=Monomorium pharaonis TaxID=307658 RepID=UPI00102E1D58|nr:uncharacterized protein LOC114255254 [Monomorium pharaonis]